MSSKKIVVTGAAGLVGQNLIPLLEQSGVGEIVALDKHPVNTATLRRLHPEIRVVEADLAEAAPWQEELMGCTHFVIGHAQIVGLYPEEFVRNNIRATERLLEAALRERQLEALVTPDVFEVFDWPRIFGVRATPLEEALKTTFCNPVYSSVALDFQRGSGVR